LPPATAYAHIAITNSFYFFTPACNNLVKGAVTGIISATNCYSRHAARSAVVKFLNREQTQTILKLLAFTVGIAVIHWQFHAGGYYAKVHRSGVSLGNLIALPKTHHK